MRVLILGTRSLTSILVSMLTVTTLSAAVTLEAFAFGKAKSEKTEIAAPAGFLSDNSGLKWKDEKVGSGAEATKGHKVKVHYVGTLYPSGKKFDSSKDAGKPFEFKLGAGEVIPGWDKGVAGMKVGGHRTLIIPSALGYGDEGFFNVIPPKATLKFDVELLDVK